MQTVFRRGIQGAARLEEPRHIFGYPDAIDEGKMEEVLVQGIGTSADGWRSRPAIAGVSTSLPIANRSAIESFIRLRYLP